MKSYITKRILEIIKEFNERGEMPCISEIVYRTPYAPTTVRRHLEYLLEKGKIEFVEGENNRKYIRLKNNGVKRRVEWSREEIETLKKLYGKLSYREIGERLCRSAGSVARMARKLGLAKPKVFPKYLEPLLTRGGDNLECYCGRKLPYPENPNKGNVHICECGVKWIWKIRSKRWVFAGKVER